MSKKRVRPRRIDVGAKQAEILQNLAMTAENRAYGAECDAEFYERSSMSEVIIEEAKKKAEMARREASIAVKKAKLTPKDIRTVRKSFLESWSERSQTEILENQLKAGLKRDAGLEEDEEPSLPDDVKNPRGEVVATRPVTIREHEEAITMFEIAEEIASERYEQVMGTRVEENGKGKVVKLKEASKDGDNTEEGEPAGAGELNN